MIPHPDAVPPLVAARQGPAAPLWPPAGATGALHVVPGAGGGGSVPHGATGRPAPTGEGVPVHWRSIQASCETTPVAMSGVSMVNASCVDPRVVTSFRSLSE